MAKKDRMGSGLDLLFEDNYHDSSGGEGGEISTLRISLIEPDKDQPRKTFDESKLKELSDNITEHGILQPILVRPIGNGSYRIVAGERRWRAARSAGLKEVPVIVRELDDAQAAQIALIENLQREDLDPVEEAQAYRRLMDSYGMTQEQLSKAVARSRSGIANSLRLLGLPDSVKKMLSEGKISVGHAKVLCGIEDGDELLQMSELAAEGISVRELENRIAEGRKPAAPPLKKDTAGLSPKIKEYTDPFKKNAAEIELSIQQNFGINAKLFKEKGGRVSLKLGFDSEDELNSFIERLTEISK